MREANAPPATHANEELDLSLLLTLMLLLLLPPLLLLVPWNVQPFYFLSCLLLAAAGYSYLIFVLDSVCMLSYY